MNGTIESLKTGAYIVAGDSLVVVIGGVNYTISKTSAMYQQVKDAVICAKWDEAANFLEQATSLKGEIWWNADKEMVYYGQEPLHHSLADRIPRIMAEGFDTVPMVKFLKNLFQNPSDAAIQELYEFMERNSLPITEDGYLLAYKKVNEDYTDCHTSKISNAIGEKPSMDRNLCDPVRTNHCSTGYHFCGLSYLTCFGGERVMVVKVNPKDVTSIPNDYNFAKGRCCTYEVVDEYGGTDVQRYEAFTSSICPSEFLDGDEEFEGEEGQDGAEDFIEEPEEFEEPNLFTPEQEPEVSHVTNPITKSRLLHRLTQAQVAGALEMPLHIYRDRIEVEGRFFKPSTIGRILHVIEVLAGDDNK